MIASFLEKYSIQGTKAGILSMILCNYSFATRGYVVDRSHILLGLYISLRQYAKHWVIS